MALCKKKGTEGRMSVLTWVLVFILGVGVVADLSIDKDPRE